MKAIAESDGRVLVALSEPTDDIFDQTLGVIVDEYRDTVSQPRFLGSFFKHGYWTPFAGDPEPVLARVRTAIEGGLLTPNQLKHIARKEGGLLGRDVPIDQLSDDFVQAYADWLGVTFGEAYALLDEEPAIDVTDEPAADTAAGSDKA